MAITPNERGCKMASVLNNTSFCYRFDNSMSLESNLKEIFKNISYLCSDNQKDDCGNFEYEIRLDVIKPSTENKNIEKLMRQTDKIIEVITEENELIPVAVDKDGEMLFKRKGAK